jgi:hypothetical protein
VGRIRGEKTPVCPPEADGRVFFNALPRSLHRHGGRQSIFQAVFARKYDEAISRVRGRLLRSSQRRRGSKVSLLRFAALHSGRDDGGVSYRSK